MAINEVFDVGAAKTTANVNSDILYGKGYSINYTIITYNKN
jgi:hypothetical protein